MPVVSMSKDSIVVQDICFFFRISFPFYISIHENDFFCQSHAACPEVAVESILPPLQDVLDPILYIYNACTHGQNHSIEIYAWKKAANHHHHLVLCSIMAHATDGIFDNAVEVWTADPFILFLGHLYINSITWVHIYIYIYLDEVFFSLACMWFVMRCVDGR
jgi:hypothetical protein